jgi:hypothetical protein
MKNLDLFSDFPDEELRTVLCMEQLTVKIYVRYKKHVKNVQHFNIIITVIPVSKQAKEKNSSIENKQTNLRLNF